MLHFFFSDEYCFAGWPIQNHGTEDAAGYHMIYPAKQITCDGVVTEWRYQAKQSYPFKAIIGRPVAGSSTKFTIIGINDIPAGAVNQQVVYSVPENDRIAVQPGDVIGWAFHNGVLSYTTGGSALVRWVYVGNNSTLNVNQISDFSGSGNRQYAIEATIQ